MITPEFSRAVNFVLAERIEGGLSLDPDDDGNWTGGKKGEGELAGTRFGISAAAYPTIDIKGLRVDDAKQIYYRDYWLRYGADRMHGRLGLAYFDACVNQGPELAARALQRALGVKEDGVVGPVTLAAARSREVTEIIPLFLAERAWQYSGTKNFQKYGRGWLRRLFYVAQAAAQI